MLCLQFKLQPKLHTTEFTFFPQLDHDQGLQIGRKFFFNLHNFKNKTAANLKGTSKFKHYFARLPALIDLNFSSMHARNISGSENILRLR